MPICYYIGMKHLEDKFIRFRSGASGILSGKVKMVIPESNMLIIDQNGSSVPYATENIQIIEVLIDSTTPMKGGQSLING